MKLITMMMGVALAGWLTGGVAQAGGACKAACGSEPVAKVDVAEAAAPKVANEPAQKKHPEITVVELKALIEKGEPLVILDARSGKWDDGKRIPGAKALSADALDAEISALIPSKDARVITYCGGVTCPASAKLANRLDVLGYKNITELPAGIAGWLEAGNKVEETRKVEEPKK